VGWTTEVTEFKSSLEQDVSLLYVVQATSGVDTRVCFPGDKLSLYEADHLSSASAGVKNAWIFASIPSWHNAYLVKQNDNFTF
jgi:hypothetical protein